MYLKNIIVTCKSPKLYESRLQDLGSDGGKGETKAVCLVLDICLLK